MKATLVLVLFCGFCAAQGTSDHPCPQGQHMEGNYNRVYACVPDADTATAQSGTQTQDGEKRGGLFGNLDTKVEDGVLQQLRPYFPKAKTKLGRNGDLIIVTCRM